MMSRLLHYRYLLLVLALVPFAQWVLSGQAAEQRAADIAGLSTELPYLSLDSQMHWIYAGGSAALFFIAAFALLSGRRAGVWILLRAMLFTGTVGIIVLLVFQVIAERSSHQTWSGSVTWQLVHFLLNGIAASYRVVENDNSSFIGALIAYTFGVGLCEETTKLLPVLYQMRNDRTASIAELRVIGFLSGIGFGVAEGVLYSIRQYNGHAAGNIYAIRFLSVVLMHGVSTAVATGLLFSWGFQDRIPERWSYENLLRVLPRFTFIIFPSMFLHALYDVLCTRGMFDGALSCELILMAILAVQIDRGRPEPVMV